MPNQLPTKLKLLRGTFQKSRGNPNEPIPTEPLGDPPSDLDRSEKSLWRELIRMTLPGVLTEQDRWAAQLLVQLMAMVRRRDPMTASQLSTLTYCLTALGLTPVARSRITVAKPKEQVDPFTEFAETP
jgi:hypothetical protein